MGRLQRRADERDFVTAQGEVSPGHRAGGLQFHARAAREVSSGRSFGRILERASQQRRRRVRRQRARQRRRSHSRKCKTARATVFAGTNLATIGGRVFQGGVKKRLTAKNAKAARSAQRKTVQLFASGNYLVLSENSFLFQNPRKHVGAHRNAGQHRSQGNEAAWA